MSPKDIAFFFNELSSLLLLLLSKGNGTLTYVRYFDVTRLAAKDRKEGGEKGRRAAWLQWAFFVARSLGFG